MGMEKKHGMMVLYMKENFNSEKKQEKVAINGIKDVLMKVNGQKMQFMDMVLIIGLMEG